MTTIDIVLIAVLIVAFAILVSGPVRNNIGALIEGVLRNCTDLNIERHFVDSHGQSEVAFAFCHLLGFELTPRPKAISHQKLNLPYASF